MFTEALNQTTVSEEPFPQHFYLARCTDRPLYDPDRPDYHLLTWQLGTACLRAFESAEDVKAYDEQAPIRRGIVPEKADLAQALLVAGATPPVMAQGERTRVKAVALQERGGAWRISPFAGIEDEQCPMGAKLP